MSIGLQRANTGFYMTQLANLSTMLREWHALHSIERVKFKDILLSGSGATETLTTLKAPRV